MSIWGHRISVKVVASATAFLVVGALLAAVGRAPDREITLVVRGMAFYLEHDPATPNPTITLQAGERVRVVLRNQDRGMSHDFSLPAAGAALDPVRGQQEASVTFEVPDEAGTYEYLCRPHALMMRGTIVVAPRAHRDS